MTIIILQSFSLFYNQLGRLSSTPTAGPYYTFEGALVLKNASSKDSGNYTCKGVNREGSTCASTEITIKQSSSSESSVIVTYIQCTCTCYCL